ncbi:hypothetical protein KAU51_00330 [Candidatus Parcubacteria bacterium]|nr:hypothetical protein [Candidatus Parcubacteria bacterium]
MAKEIIADDSWKKNAGKTILVLNGRVIFADEDIKKVEKRRLSYFEPSLRSQIDIVRIPTAEEEEEEMLKDIDMLSKKYGGIREVIEIFSSLYAKGKIAPETRVGLGFCSWWKKKDKINKKVKDRD